MKVVQLQEWIDRRDDRRDEHSDERGIKHSENRHQRRGSVLAVETADTDANTVADALTCIERSLSRSDKSESELVTMLREREFATDVIDSAINTAKARGYLDEQRLAETLIRTRFDHRSLGTQGIRRELLARGLSKECVEQAVSTLDPDRDFDSALEFAETRASRMLGLDRATARRRLTGQLQRRGYSSDAISNVLKQVL